MSNRTITDEAVMQERWKLLIADMKEINVDCLLMYSTDRIYSGYLRYVTDCPTSLYPISALFSEKGISLVGHGVKDVPLFPLPPEKMPKGAMHFHSGGIKQHDFVKDMIGVPACPTTNYVSTLWAEALGELIKKYDYKRIGIVGTNIVPTAFVTYLQKTMPELVFIDATIVVDERKGVKSPYELKQAQHCTDTIDQIIMDARSVIRPYRSLRDVGKKLRAIADDLDCLDLNIMLGKHPTMPMFAEWLFTDDEIIQPDDCIELMVEVSDKDGFWGECARVYSLDKRPEALVKMAQTGFDLQDYVSHMLIPGADPSEIFEKYCDRLESLGLPREKRFFCHGQGYDVVEMPFIRPENTKPLQANAFVALHPSIYKPQEQVGCFVCDNYLILDNGSQRMNKVPREILQAVY